jgi:hypothetical protein
MPQMLVVLRISSKGFRSSSTIEVQIIKFTNCRENLFPQLLELETCQMEEIQQQVRSLS